MNVLSLFDGMSCGQIALNRAGIKYNKYYASEIDKYAIEVTKKNYPNTIHLGDIRRLKSKYLDKIDLLIGGSPCQGFSFAGKHLNFNDPRSALFFEYIRLLKECKPKYFLLENVIMLAEHNDVISATLGEIYPECVNQLDMLRPGRLEPFKINSSLVSAQSRNRLYWTNIMGIKQPDDKGILLKDILESGKPSKEKSQTILSTIYKENEKSMLKRKKMGLLVMREKSKTVRSSGRVSRDRHEWDSIDNTHIRKLTPMECERLQTVPDNYSDCVSNSQRYKMLGNGWTVEVISHIFSNLK